MFGARPPFSGTSSFSGFGAAANTQQPQAFGGFGRTTTFGAQSTDSGFGSTATTSTPFGSTAATGSSLFGSTGQTNTNTGTGLFGSSSTGGFGATNTGGFTAAAGNTGGGLFGTQNTAAQPSTGLFGSTTATNNAFNTQQKPFGFSTPTSSAGGGLFNTASTGAGLFGSNTGGSNIVGTTVKYQPVTGSDTMTRNGVTTNIQTRIEVITCMKEYEGKSLEELRVEDYLANRKGPGQGGGGLMGGAFGQNTATGGGGLFGSTGGSQLGAGATTGGLFGTKPPENKSLFGAPTNTGFGVVASSTGGGLFGSTNAAPAFGQAGATSTGTGFTFGLNTQQANQNKTGFTGFTNTAGGGLFGQQQQQQTQQQQQPATTGFGATNTGFSFGQVATPQQNQTGGLFNQAKPAFGAPTSTTGGGLFGTKTAAAPAFGGFNTGNTTFGTSSTSTPFGTTTNTNTGGGLFGNTQNKTGFGLGTGFGTNTGSTFNTSTSGGGLFSNTAANTGGLFGNTANQNKPAGGLTFNTGNTFNSGTNTLGFGLNNNANKPTGFGALGGGFGTGLSLGGGTSMAGANAGGFTGGIGDNNIANLIKALTDNPFGHSSLLKTPLTTTGKADELLSPPSSNSKHLASSSSSQPPTYVLPSTKMSSSIQLRANTMGAGGTSTSSNMLNNRNLLFAGLDDTNESNGGEEMFKTKSFPSVKKLNLKVFNNLKNGPSSPQMAQPGSGASSPSIMGGESGRSSLPLTTPLHRPSSPPRSRASPAFHGNNNNDTSGGPTPDIIKGRSNMKRLNLTYKKQPGAFNDTLADLNVGHGAQMKGSEGGHDNTLEGNASFAGNASHANFSLYEASSQDFADGDLNGSALPHPTGIKLSRPGYYTIPPLSELTGLIDDQNRCLVENFSVGREGYGNVCFTSETDVMGLDLDSIVFIVRKEVEVYPDAATKPKVGEGLNKPAVVTLDAVWPIDKSSRDVIKDTSRLESMGWPRYLEKKCLNMGAKFLEYRPDTGSWVFKVNHFSKYGLEDDDDEFGPDELLKAQQLQLQQQKQLLQQQQQQLQQQQQSKHVNYDLDISNLPKTTDVSLIKSSGSKHSSSSKGAQPSTSTAASTDGGADGSVTTTSSGSLSSSSSGLGGGAVYSGPPTHGLVSPPPTHHLLPHHSDSAAVAGHYKSPAGVRGSGSTTTTAVSPATVPGEIFLDSFANEPDEGASMGASFQRHTARGRGGNSAAMQQLTANMFPMEEDEDLDDLGDGFGATSTLVAADMDVTLSRAGSAEAAVPVSGLRADAAAMEEDARHWREGASVKKFAGNRLEQLNSGQEAVSVEGCLSPSVGEHTIVKPKRLGHLQQQHSLVSPSSAYRAARTDYPSLPSVGGGPAHPPVVASVHSAIMLPLAKSLLMNQHRSICDVGAFMGASSRVGWGPAWQLVHAGKQLSTQVDVVGAVAAQSKRQSAKAVASAGPAAFLFLPQSGASSGGSSSAATHALQGAADLPNYEVTVEKLHLTDLSVACDGSPDPDTALRTVEACLRDVLRYSTFGRPSQSGRAAGAAATVAAPHFQPTMDSKRERKLLHRLAATVKQPRLNTAATEGGSQLSAIFDLCMALWGKLDYGWLEDAAGDSEYVQARARVETLSQWVESVSQASVNREVQASLLDNDTRSSHDQEAHLEAVFSHLTARELQQACELLQDKGDHHLALLLAQICMGDDTCRQILYKQLANWAECGADNTMSSGRLVLYVLAAGQATYNSGSGLINVCKGLDWRRALAVHLWYICPSTCTISEALQEYERGAGLLQDDATTPYCQQPLPQYLADHTLPDSSSRVSYDICYHLLKLYTDPSYRLDQLLNPATNTPDPLDVTTSWLVMAVIQSLGYSHVNPVVANGMHLTMAAYLEAAGLWHWAIFVLLSLKEDNCRSAEVRAVLSRHVQVVEGIELEDDSFLALSHKQQQQQHEQRLAVTMTTQAQQAAMEEDDVGFVEGDCDDNSMDTTMDHLTRRNNQHQLATSESIREAAAAAAFNDVEKEEEEEVEGAEGARFTELDTYEDREAFLVKRLHVPERWVNEAKAILARSLGMVEEEAWYLIKAGDLVRAHSLLIDTIAPTAIINEDHEYLQRYITAFEASSSSLDVNVPEWKTGGGVYAHYLHILSAVEEIKVSQQPTQDKVERLRPRLLALCEQLNSLRTPTARHRLCVSEVSRVVVGVLRAVLGDDLAATTAIANQVAALPLSQDCALQELNTLTHQYLTGVAN